MLIYVIPLVLLIIVLLVIKKRQDTQGSDKAKATTARTRKTTSSARTTPQKAKVVEAPAPESKESVPLSADLRKKIERLINEGNFFAAEAQINQALKKDSRQHELYLLLLDIHIEQKDEFAISQLINHLYSLGLDDVIKQAKAKKTEFEAKQSSTQDTAASAQPETTENKEFAFTPSSVSNDQAFEQLQQEITPSKTVDQQPLEFNFTPSSPTAESTPEPQTEDKLEFDFNSLQADIQTEVAKAEPAAEIPSFDFESFNTQTSTEQKAAEPTSVAEPEVSAPTMDFKLDFASSDKTEPTTTPVEEPVTPLDFSFSVESAAPTVEKPDATPEFDLSSLGSTEPAPAAAAPVDTTDVEFKLDSVPEKPAGSTVSFEIPTTPSVSANDQNDPLVQSFPELATVDEIILNLDLAQQYIQLGAYDAAREILAEKEADYTPQQRTQVDHLLNQIAS